MNNHNIPGKQDNDLKFHLMKMIGAFKEDIHNTLKKYRKTQANMLLRKKQILKEMQENTIKQVKELNKMV